MCRRALKTKKGTPCRKHFLISQLPNFPASLFSHSPISPISFNFNLSPLTNPPLYQFTNHPIQTFPTHRPLFFASNFAFCLMLTAYLLHHSPFITHNSEMPEGQPPATFFNIPTHQPLFYYSISFNICSLRSLLSEIALLMIESNSSSIVFIED